jgi:hypothetical protein
MSTRTIEDVPNERLSPGELARRARAKVREARTDGVERLWNLQADALERVETLLERAPDKVPILSRVASRASRLVHDRLEMVTALAIPEYDELNAKKIRQSLRGLDRLDLVRVRRYETSHKNRKSVLGDLDRELLRLDQPGLEDEEAPEAEV